MREEVIERGIESIPHRAQVARTRTKLTRGGEEDVEVAGLCDVWKTSLLVDERQGAVVSTVLETVVVYLEGGDVSGLEEVAKSLSGGAWSNIIVVV